MSMSASKDIRLALDRVAFAYEVLPEVERLDPWEEELLLSRDRRMLLNIFRQGGKSTMTAVLALHQALYHRGSLILILAPALRQATEFFEKVSDAYRLLTGEGLAIGAESDRKLGIKLKNGSRIECLPGSQRTIRGFSKPDLIIVDEAAQVDDALYSAILPMLTRSKEGGRLLMLSTPYGRRGIYWRLWKDGARSGSASGSPTPTSAGFPRRSSRRPATRFWTGSSGKNSCATSSRTKWECSTSRISGPPRPTNSNLSH
jgi:hypothetical protein